MFLVLDVLLLTAGAFLGSPGRGFIPLIRPSDITKFDLKSSVNEWDMSNLHKHIVLDIDDNIIPYEVSDTEIIPNPRVDSRYYNSIIKSLLELEELPEPVDNAADRKYTRGTFRHPVENYIFEIQRTVDNRYKLIPLSDGDVYRRRRSPAADEDDVGEESDDFAKNKNKPPVVVKNGNKNSDKKKGDKDSGRIIGGSSALMFTNVNHKFRDMLPG